MLELVPENKKEFCTTTINLVDCAVLFIMGTFIMLGFKDLAGLVEIINLYYTFIVIIYLIIAPESPYYLFIKDRRKEGIDALNYIAWLNGSNNRINSNAQFDMVSEIIK